MGDRGVRYLFILFFNLLPNRSREQLAKTCLISGNLDKTQSDQNGIGQTCMDTGLIRRALIQVAAFYLETPTLDIGRKSHSQQTQDSPDSPPFRRKHRAGPMSQTIQIKSQA